MAKVLFKSVFMEKIRSSKWFVEAKNDDNYENLHKLTSLDFCRISTKLWMFQSWELQFLQDRHLISFEFNEEMKYLL